METGTVCFDSDIDSLAILNLPVQMQCMQPCLESKGVEGLSNLDASSCNDINSWNLLGYK